MIQSWVGVSHVVVDEVHERTVDGDFLLLLLKQLLLKRKDLTVILMSATVEADEYAKYFSDYTVGRVHIEGRTFPVQDIHLEWVLSMTGYRPSLRKLRKERDYENDEFGEGIGEALNVLNEGILDYELIARTVLLICEENKDNGGILIFLPGTTLFFTSLTYRYCRNLPMHQFNKQSRHRQDAIYPSSPCFPPFSRTKTCILSTAIRPAKSRGFHQCCRDFHYYRRYHGRHRHW